MTQYNITSQSSLDYGIFDGDTPADAFAAMCRDAGYDVTVVNGEVVFASDRDAEECGHEEDWFITSLPAIGARVEGGDGEDHDTGTVREHLDGAQVLVAWDSGVVTPAPASILTVI